MTSFQSYLRCRKSFYYGDVLQRSPLRTNDAVEDGLRFHEIMADIGRAQMTAKQIVEKYGESDPMLQVAGAYLRQHPLRGETLFIEEPLYTLVLPENDPALRGALPMGEPASSENRWTSPAVYIRTTFDRVARENDWIHGEDYKTFERAPTFDDDLNFQFRTYTGALWHHFKTDRVSFTARYVRRAVPGSPKGAWDIEEDGEFYSVTAGGKRTRKDKWLTSECYKDNEIVMAQHEVEAMWSELQDIARDMVRNIYVEPRWYRTPLAVGPHSCNSCFVRDLCSAELRTGTLSKDDLEMLSAPRDDAARMSPEGLARDPRSIFDAQNLVSA